MATEIPRTESESYRETFLGKKTFELLGTHTANDITIINDWHKPGAESYVTDFTLRQGDTKRHLIAKACVKMMPRETMAEWLTRRRALKDNGVSTPELFAVDGAMIIEEYIPFTFSEAYKNDTVRSILRVAFTDMYKRTVGIGFLPISFHDIRSRGDDCVMVDVGEDLGGLRDITACSLDTISNAEQQLAVILGE